MKANQPRNRGLVTCQVDDTAESSAAARSEEDAKEAEPDLPLVDFGVVVAGKEHFDVCRLFLASLQLVSDHGWLKCAA